MRASLSSFTIAAAVLFGLFATPTAAQADDTVFVLGIRSVQGDDELTRNLTGAVRQEASRVRGWSVSDTEVSLDQMALAHDCDEPDPACLANIATALSADKIIYGTVNRAGGEDNYNFALSIYIFDAASGSIAESETDTIPRISTDIDNLRPRASRYIAKLSGQRQFGSLRIESDAPGAQVRIDGVEVGVLDDDGNLVVNDVEVGERLVELESEDYSIVRTATEVAPDTQRLVRAPIIGGMQETGPVDNAGGGGLSWLPGVGLMVVGGVFLGLTALSWTKIRGIDDADGNIGPNDPWDAFRGDARDMSAPQDANICDAPNYYTSDPMTQAQREDLCASASKWQTLQFVFGGLGVAALAAGIALYVIMTGDEDADQARLQLSPTFSRNSAGASLRLGF